MEDFLRVCWQGLGWVRVWERARFGLMTALARLGLGIVEFGQREGDAGHWKARAALFCVACWARREWLTWMG
eukprot:1317292-Amorphochlora_amoeboformis.AAC.1